MTGPDRRALGWATALLALVMAVVTFTGPRGLFGGDEGVKLIQAFGVLEHGLDDPWLPYPAAVFDPEENNHPVVEPHVVRHHGHRYGIYPITFTAPSAVAWWAGGFWALHLLAIRTDTRLTSDEAEPDVDVTERRAALEAIALQAEVLELRANPNRAASGAVIEAKLDGLGTKVENALLRFFQNTT